MRKNEAGIAGQKGKEEKHYLVQWEIDIWADNPTEAARQALRIQRDPESIATVFTVITPGGKRQQIDLAEEDEKVTSRNIERCPYCGREEDGRWFDPCPAEDCPSHESGSEPEHQKCLIKEWRERTTKKVEAILSAVDSEDAVVRDTITNLLHWCNEKAIDFEDELRIARDNFTAEAAGLE